MSDNPNETLIAEETEFDGDLSSRCPVTLSGTLKGKLSAPCLTVTPTGAIHGDVKVNQLNSDGEISGNIAAEIVQLSGKVSDNTVINATTLELLQATAYRSPTTVTAGTFLKVSNTGSYGGNGAITLEDGATLTHNGLNAVEYFDIRTDDHVFVVAPLFHSLGLQILALPALYAGASLRIQEGFEAERAWKTIEAERISYFGGVPTMHQRLVDALDD